MMKRIASVLFAGLLISSAPSFAEGDTPAAKLRTLTLEFDKIVNGSSTEPTALAQAREKYGAILREASASGLNNQELREHAEVFVLSGGDVAVLKPFGEGLQPDTQEKKLFDGVVAYGMGQARQAEKTLLSLDGATFDAIRGAHLCLVQAQLTSRTHPEQAFDYYAKARLLLPGTLVEEAAWRQTVALAARTGDKERFSNGAISYLRRFPHSTYAPGFETQLASYIVDFDGSDGVDALQNLMETHPQGWGHCIDCFLTNVGEQALILGKVDLAAAATKAALGIAAVKQPERQRLLLYEGAALIVTPDFAQGEQVLNSVDPTELDENDKDLLSASLELAAKLRATPVLSNQTKLSVLAFESTRHDHDFTIGPREKEAKAALASADAILAKAK